MTRVHTALSAALVSAVLMLHGVDACAVPARVAAPKAANLRARTITGDTVDLDTLLARGPVLLDFWATWCRPCLESIPELEALYQRHRGAGLTVIGVSIDGPRNHSKVRPFASRLGVTYPIVLDEDGTLQEKFRVRAVPTAILIDRDGTVARVAQGFRPGEGDAMESAIAARLAVADSTAASDSTARQP